MQATIVPYRTDTLTVDGVMMLGARQWDYVCRSLQSRFWPRRWPVGTWATSYCQRGGHHRQPVEYCGCGIYAYLAGPVNVATDTLTVAGVVALAGRIIRMRDCCRAERALPLALFGCREIDRQAAAHQGIPLIELEPGTYSVSELVERYLTTCALCGRHPEDNLIQTALGLLCAGCYAVRSQSELVSS